MGDRDRTPGRDSLGEVAEQQGFGAALGQAAGMLLPQTGTGGQITLDQIVSDFVNYLPVIGDAQDLYQSATDQNLDVWERGLGYAAGAGLLVGGAKVAQMGVHGMLEQSRRKALTAEAAAAAVRPSMYAPEGIGYVAPEPGVGTDRRRQELGYAWQQYAKDQPDHYATATAGSFDELADRAAGGMQYIATVLKPTLEQMGRDIVAQNAGPAYGDQSFDAGRQELLAAASAVAKWDLAVDSGLINASIKTRELHQAPPDIAVQLYDGIVNWEIQTQKMGIGPDLIPGPLFSLKSTMSTRPEPVLAVELAPDRLYDTDTGRVLPGMEEEVAKRWRNLDLNSITPEMAYNLMRAAMREQDVAPKRWQRNLQWYPRARKAIDYLVQVTNRPSLQLSGTFSALSPQTPWTPDNVVAATHLILINSGFEAGSPEYRQHFRAALAAGDFAHDLRLGTAKAVREQLKDDDALYDYWSDPANLTTVNGKIRGAYMEMNTNAADLILNQGVPWQAVLRASKTHNFAWLIHDPDNPNLVVVDTHAFSAAVGTTVGYGSPTVSAGARPIANFERSAGVQLNAEYLTPEAIAAAEMAGVNVTVPSGRAASQYEAVSNAYRLVAGLLGLDTANAAQAGIWTGERNRKKYLNARVKKASLAKDYDELARLQLEKTPYPEIFAILEGQPSFSPALQDLAVDSTFDYPVSYSVSGTTSPILIVAMPDGDLAAYVKLPGNTEAFRTRYASVLNIEIPGRHRMLERAPRNVDTIDNHVPAGTAHTTVQATGRHPAFNPDDTLRIDVDPAYADDVARFIVGNSEAAFTVTQTSGISQRTGYAGTVDPADYDGHYERLFADVDWVAISTETSERTGAESVRELKKLATRIRRAGGQAYLSEGVYGGYTEPSLFVTGIGYDRALAYAKEYGQEAIATRNGLIYTDGTYQPAVGDPTVGDLDPDGGYTTVNFGEGKAVTFQQTYGDERVPFDDVAETRADPQPAKVTLLDVTVGGPHQRVSMNTVERVATAAARMPGVANVALYGHGQKPVGWNVATEQVMTDVAGRTMAVRHAGAPDPHAIDAVPVYMPPWQTGSLDQAAPRTRTMQEVRDQHRAQGDILHLNDVTVDYTATPNPKIRANVLDVGSVTDHTVDLTGHTPVILVGQAGLPEPGRVAVHAGNGYVYVDAAGVRDANLALRVLGYAGVPTAEAQIRIAGDELPTEWSAVLPDTVVRRELYRETLSNENRHRVGRVNQRLRDVFNVDDMVTAGDKGVDGLDQIADILISLFNGGDLFEDFKKLRGSHLNPILFTTPRSGPEVYVAGVGNSQSGQYDYGQTVIFDGPMAISETLVDPAAAAYVHRGRVTYPNFHFGPPGEELAQTVTHETGHKILQLLDREDLRSEFAARTVWTVRQLGGIPAVGQALSQYGARNMDEFWAEAFSKTVLYPEQTDPVIRDYVLDVLNVLENPPTVVRWDRYFFKLGASTIPKPTIAEEEFIQ